MCTNTSTGTYLLSFIVPSTASKGKLEFLLSGEQSDFELPINNASIVSGSSNCSVKKISGNSIYLESLTKGTSLKIEVTVEFTGYCMMEVEYYANKK